MPELDFMIIKKLVNKIYASFSVASTGIEPVSGASENCKTINLSDQY
jgi:hypothetical protein